MYLIAMASKSRSKTNDGVALHSIEYYMSEMSIPECDCLYPNVLLSISEGVEVSSGTRRLSYA